MKLLLGREEVNPDMTDIYGWTPLYFATMLDQVRMAALLRSHKAVTPSTT